MSSDLEVFEAPGLSADWLNAWLAAIGVTVLLPDVKLSWTDAPIPTARFWADRSEDLATLLADSLPSPEDLNTLAIAPSGPGGQWGQKIKSFDLYSVRCGVARANNDSTVSCTVTDLGEEFDGTMPARGQFCVGMEGAETIWKRLRKCVLEVDDADSPRDAIEATLSGDFRRIIRLGANGLGFDARRLPPGPDSGDGRWPAVDPVVEVLAFFAITQLPVRGAAHPGAPALQKPWALVNRRPSLTYSTWLDPLDWWAIDALLDSPQLVGERASQFRVRRYENRGGEKKVAYFSEPVQ